MSWIKFFKIEQCFFCLLLILFYILLGSCSTKENEDKTSLIDSNTNLHKGDSLLGQDPSLALSYSLLALKNAKTNNQEFVELQALALKAKALLQLNRNEEAANCLEEMLDISMIEKDIPLMAETYKNLGIAEMKLRHYHSAIIAFRKTLNYPEQAALLEIYAEAAEGLGDIYAHIRYPNSALKYYRKAQDYSKRQKDGQSYNLIGIKIGNIYAEEGKQEAALKVYEKSLHYFNAQHDSARQAIAFSKMGKLQLLQGNIEDALSSGIQAKQRALESSNLQVLRESYEIIAQVAVAQGRYQEANINWLASLELADILNEQEAMSETYKQLAAVNDKLGHRKQAIAYYEKYVKSVEQALKEKKNDESRVMLTAIKLDRSEKEIASLKRKNEVVEKYSSIRSQGLGDNRSFIILLTAFVVVFVLLVAVYYQRFKDKKNASAILEEMVRKRTAELHHALQKLFFHMNNTSLAVIELDPDFQITGWTGQAEKIFGWKSQEVLGKQFLDIGVFDQEELLSIKSIFKRIKTGKLSKKFLLTQSKHKEHQSLFIEWNLSVLYDEAGEITSISCFANNVTHREKALLEAETANKELDNFIYKTSHDVKGPIARIEGLINLGIIEAQEEVSKQYFTMLKQVSADFNIVLSRLFRIHGIYYHKPVAVSLNLKQEIKTLIGKLQKKNALYELKYEVDIPGDIKWKVDKLLFYIIIQNIYENALDYRRDSSSKIVFSVEVLSANYLKLHIRDNGTCVPLHAADRIFDMFFQNTTQSNTAGLGMYMVKKSVEKLGGTIKLLKGDEETFFEILLPSQ